LSCRSYGAKRIATRRVETIIRPLPIAMAVLATILFGGGCTFDASRSDRLPEDGAELPILRQWSRVHSHETRTMRLAIRSAADLAMIPLEEFDVDFSREMVLIVTLGRVPSDQYRVRIDGLRRERGQLIADVRIIEPPAGAPLVVASPYCVAVTPRCDLPVRGFATRPPPRQRTWTQSELRPPRE